MRIKAFAEANRFHFRMDGCNDPIVQGKLGHLYEHSGTQLGICLEHPVTSKRSIRFMRNRVRQLGHLGLRVKQEGDSEGTWLLPLDFSPEHPIFAQVLKVVGIRKIRKATGRPFEKRT